LNTSNFRIWTGCTKNA